MESDNAKNLPRCDYKEFLQLARIILGQRVERKKGYNYILQIPGTDHHGCWMSKSIYIMKMSLLRLLHQLDLHGSTGRLRIKYRR